ncbi:MAG TPA: tripartite tricarboxylate transporter substrate-binding protein [Afifellaceae bacterium]|nr:tripartite tricarboxylate transporter substrate-binding protein [Afifellaceae bacterium]
MKGKWPIAKYLGSGLLALATAAFAMPAAAEWPNDKPIRFVIPYSPGGGFDTIVRAFAPALEKELGAEVVPENIAGAGGTKGAATVHRSDPDGYTIGIYNIPGFTVNQVIGKDMGFNLDEVTWIANLATSRYAVAVKGDSEIDSVEKLCSLGREAKMSDTGASSTASVTTRIAFQLLDCPISDITGYKGSNDAMIAVMRGEVDATVKPIASLKKYTDSGDLKIIATFTKDDVLEGIPGATSIGKPELANFDLRRIIGGPPDLPPEIVEKLSAAFIAAANSAEVQEWANGAGVELEPVGADEASAIMSDLATFYAQYKDMLMAK